MDAGGLGADAALFIGAIRETHSRLSSYICQLVRLVSKDWFPALVYMTHRQDYCPGLVSKTSRIFLRSSDRHPFNVLNLLLKTILVVN